MDSTLRRAALSALLALASLSAAAYNHELEVSPLSPGKFAVACSNIEHDLGRMAQLGGVPTDYWEGHEVNGQQRYITDILAQPNTAIEFEAQVPFKFDLYPSRFGQRIPFAALVCHPTSRTNTDPSYTLPGAGGVVPHMQRPGAAPQLISGVEFAQTLGLDASGASSNAAQLPFIVYSHGLGGSPLGKGYIDVMVQLAAQGYVVAAVFHADARFSRIRIEDFADLAYALAFFPLIVEMQALRPLALKAMTDRVLASGYSAAIDRTRIGGFGASLGGEAMAHLLGARITSSLSMSCDETVRDPRIRAAVGYVPYSGQSFLPAFCNDQEGADSVNRPYLAISGTFDTTAPIKMTQQAVNRFGDSRFLVQLEGGEHELRPEDAGDVLTWMVTFLNAYLDVRADPGAMGRFIRMNSVRGGRPDSVVVDVHVPFPPAVGDTRVVEFYNTGLNHFFLTASASDIAIIHAGGAGPGWIETGHAFKAWLQPMPAFQTNPVCRFYGGYNGGPNSHFFTAIPSDCELVKTSYPGWTYEGIGFHVMAPVNGACPAGYIGVNRAYNNGYVRNDSNHRFTTSDSEIKALARNGWTYEGIAMCSLP